MKEDPIPEPYESGIHRYPLAGWERGWSAAALLLAGLALMVLAKHASDSHEAGNSVALGLGQTTFLWLLGTGFAIASLARILPVFGWIEIGSNSIRGCFLGQKGSAVGTDSLVLQEITTRSGFWKVFQAVMVFRQGSRLIRLPAPDHWLNGSPVRERLIEHLISLGVKHELPLYEAQATGDEWPLMGMPDLLRDRSKAESIALAVTCVFFLVVLSFFSTRAAIDHPDILALTGSLAVAVILAWIAGRRFIKKREGHGAPVFILNGVEAKLTATGRVVWREDRSQVRELVLVVRRSRLLGWQFRYELETLYSRRHPLCDWLSCSRHNPGPMMNRARLTGLQVKLDSDEGSSLLPWDA